MERIEPVRRMRRRQSWVGHPSEGGRSAIPGGVLTRGNSTRPCGGPRPIEGYQPVPDVFFARVLSIVGVAANILLPMSPSPRRLLAPLLILLLVAAGCSKSSAGDNYKF